MLLILLFPKIWLTQEESQLLIPFFIFVLSIKVSVFSCNHVCMTLFIQLVKLYNIHGSYVYVVTSRPIKDFLENICIDNSHFRLV